MLETRLKYLFKLATAFDSNFPEARADIYLDELAAYKTENLGWAVSKAIRTCDRFPTVAKLIELCNAAPALKTLRLEHHETVSEEQRIANMKRFDDIINGICSQDDETYS